MIIKKHIVGIDLGTTNSAISTLDAGTPIIIPNAEGFRTTPSIISYTNRKECLVGHIAKRQTILNPENTFSSVKRFIGCKFNEIKNEINYVTYPVKEDKNGNVKLYCSILDKEISPEEISALILKKLVIDAQTFLNQEIKQAVITVPAYFNDSQRMGTKDAGIIAGLDVLRILNEPTAAALAYGFDKKKNEIILIFDLGGGTFDVSILEVGSDVFEVLATSGNTHLGGNDIDKLIFNYILSKFEETSTLNIREDKQALQRILDAAEKAKIELSSSQSTEINIPFIGIQENIPQHIVFDLTRLKLNELISSLILECKIPVENALKDSKLTKSDINQIILVGGSTRIPLIRSFLIDYFGKSLNETVNPDEVVAMGAAIQGGILAGEITDLILLDVTPLSLGIETQGGLMTPIIRNNSSIPIKQTEIFSTAVDYQPTVEIHVLQGERPLAKDNKSLGSFLLNISSAKAGIPKIQVTFQLDVNGILSVTARDEVTQQEQSITIKNASVLSKDELDKIVEDAKNNSKFDKFKALYIPFIYNFDHFIYSVESLLETSTITLNKITLNYINEQIKYLKFLYTNNIFDNIFLITLMKLNLILKLNLIKLLK